MYDCYGFFGTHPETVRFFISLFGFLVNLILMKASGHILFSMRTQGTEGSEADDSPRVVGVRECKDLEVEHCYMPLNSAETYIYII